MKIGLVIERFDPEHGGAEHWTWQFARSLVRRGHEVHVVAFKFHAGSADDGIVPHRLEMPEPRLDRAAAMVTELSALKFDIVHDMGVGWAADIIEPHAGSTKALWEHNLMRIPKWRQIRFWREKRYGELEEIERRQHANQNAIIVAVSRMLAESFESLHHLPAARIRVIYNGVDVERFAPSNREKYREATRRELGLRDDEVLFLGLAHNLLLKNAEATVRAAARLAATGAPLRVVIAGGKKTERFIELVRKLKIEHLVTFPGLVDPVPYHAAADVFVHPTWYDPCSLVTLEASSCGLPVITSRFNGAAELMTDGKEGFVLKDPADSAALAKRMKELLEPARRETMGAAGRALAMQHTFEEQTTKFLELYQEIVSTRQRLPP
ncbi:MAG TPA: glycosyltransferase family 4 protein [Chthoniobacterales bacterium]|jgi:UDP-glucose:(heptosyl)LPS alpha-1,3-glucosyltransferase|nr:glycosyltransferase family 4 protein [Chthoniobacterales bacterium]